MVCKQILGVQKQTTNIGVLLELGRIPVTRAAVKNWERTEKGEINPIIFSSYLDKTHNESNRSVTSPSFYTLTIERDFTKMKHLEIDIPLQYTARKTV